MKNKCKIFGCLMILLIAEGTSTNDLIASCIRVQTPTETFCNLRQYEQKEMIKTLERIASDDDFQLVQKIKQLSRRKKITEDILTKGISIKNRDRKEQKFEFSESELSQLEELLEKAKYSSTTSPRPQLIQPYSNTLANPSPLVRSPQPLFTQTHPSSPHQSRSETPPPLTPVAQGSSPTFTQTSSSISPLPPQPPYPNKQSVSLSSFFPDAQSSVKQPASSVLPPPPPNSNMQTFLPPPVGQNLPPLPLPPNSNTQTFLPPPVGQNLPPLPLPPNSNTQTQPSLTSFFPGSSPTITQTSSSIPQQERPEIKLSKELFNLYQQEMNGDLSHNYTHDTYLMDMLMNLPQASQLAQIRGLSTWTKILDKRTWDIVSINKLLNKFYRAAQYGQLSYPTLQEGNQYGITFLDIMNFTTLLAIHDCVSMKYSYAQRPYPGTQTPPPLASFFSGSSPTVTQTSSSIPRQERPEITLANEIFKRREEQAGISSQHIVNDMHWVHSFIKLNQDKQQKIISELLNLPAKDKMQGADELLNKINTVVQSTQLNQQAIQEGNKYGITFSDAVNFATLLAIRHNKERRTTSSSTLSISPLLSSLRPNNRLSLSSTSDSRHVERNENSISASPSNDASSMELNNSQQNSSTKKRSRYESNNAIDQNDNQRSMLPPAKRIRATEQNPAD